MNTQELSMNDSTYRQVNHARECLDVTLGTSLAVASGSRRGVRGPGLAAGQERLASTE